LAICVVQVYMLNACLVTVHIWDVGISLNGLPLQYQEKGIFSSWFIKTDVHVQFNCMASTCV